MKAWTFALALTALASAVVGTAVVATRGVATGQGQAAALGLGERAREDAEAKAKSPTPQAVAPLPSSESPAAAAPPPVTPESLGVAAADSAPSATTATKPLFRQTHTYAGGVVYVPVTCSGPYDVIVHFHGTHTYVRDLVEKANIKAVVAVFNAGNGAERYAQSFQGGGMLSALLQQIELASAPLCPSKLAKPKRLALSAWSAGYAAVEKLVARPEDRGRVDAVLLADGMHAALMDRRKRTFAPNALEAFVELGKSAVAGEKLFAITHSSIETPGYGSTTECAKLLLGRLNLPTQGDFVSCSAEDFSVEGSGGGDKAAHIAQFRQMDAALLSKLRKRWGE